MRKPTTHRVLVAAADSFCGCDVRSAVNKKKRGEEFSSLAEPASFSVSFPEFQPSDRLHFWTTSSSHPEELIQRVFGCKAFVHIPKDERSKLDVKTKPFIFLGYGQDEFGYRLYDPVLKKLVRSRDVVFMENQTLKDIEKVQMVPQYSDDLMIWIWFLHNILSHKVEMRLK
ncbi:hypothetical protein E3N88_12845 [Mikania micrantha]|uniref:Retroviral polymerase SH3-like domain-containing protein n=1 Tax=Mikania micrantha TaxID=192012 RepID=A0A5N6P9M3_9ASTR|nr:hypothetical protein E3N88_12845 [Mikania micrantha]